MRALRGGRPWTLPGGARAGVRLLTQEPAELHRARLLEPSSIEPLLREYGGEGVRVEETRRVKTINARLSRQSGDGFEVRVKGVFAVRSAGADRGSATRLVFVKSVGWGGLGYHAY